jgi:hypothetical protein
MKKKIKSCPLVLGLYPVSGGFGFALMEGPLQPVDWGIRVSEKNNNKECLKRFIQLVDFYRPKVLVLDDYTGEGSRRGKRTKCLIDEIISLATNRDLIVCGYAPKHVQNYFAKYQAHTKHEVAATIASWMPRFQPVIPQERKTWTSESRRMGMFNAIALVLTHYHYQRQK